MLILAAALNIALELVFILRFSMGVADAAWAAVFAQLIAGLLLIVYIRRYPAAASRQISVAAYAAAQKIDMIAGMPTMSFGIAMAAYAAQNYGANKPGRIKRGVRERM